MAEEYSYELKIPRERVAVLIGKSGETKRSIEDSTDTKIKVDSKEGDIFIYGKDALGLYACREIVVSIGRGFNPDIAKLLLKQDYILEVIPLNDFMGKSRNTLLRLKGRIIGKEGKSRRQIEELSEAHVCVYGKTVGILGLPESASMAKKAVESLLRGSTHANVYKWLEKRRRELKRERVKELI